MQLVSVVIPCFNGGEHLAEAVQSVLDQTYPDIEIIIADDGSTDDATRALLAQAQWPRTTIHRQENQGPSAARNMAIRHARGEYILPLDADDKIAPTYIEKAVAMMEADHELGIVYCKAIKFGAEQGPWILPEYTVRELVIDNVIFVTALFRKRDWERVGGYNERLRKGVEDYDFWVKLVNLGCHVHQLSEPLFHYRVQPVSRSSEFYREPAHVVDTYSEIFRGNIEFYAKHAEFLFEHRFGLYREIDYWRQKYGRIEEMSKRSWLVRLAGRAINRLLDIKSTFTK